MLHAPIRHTPTETAPTAASRHSHPAATAPLPDRQIVDRVVPAVLAARKRYGKSGYHEATNLALQQTKSPHTA